MAKLKIYGNANPVVGKKEFYSIDEFFAPSPSLQLPETDFKITPQEEVKWSIWVKYGNEWTKMISNNKTGTTVCYTFSQVSITRKGIRMLVEKNGEKALLEIQTHKTTNPSIVKVDLLDANYNIPTKAFAYGETIIARVHCVDMEMLQAKVTLWEDNGDKNNAISSNLIIESKQGNILNGICEISFYLNPMNAWRVNANNANEGEMHEYYVTAEIFTKKYNTATTKNTNVANPQYIPSPAEQKGPSNKDQQQIAMSDRRVHDYNEQRVKISPTIAFPVREVTNSLMMVDMDPQSWWPFKEDNCGGEYCIKKGDKNELIREINIRLAGFGGNVPTDEFTDRTENMIKQFQRDYMKVSETGRICGNVLNAIDEFQQKYPINFDEIKCQCGTCNGYGKRRNIEEYQNISLLEKRRKYEYPGIHRSLICGFRASLFYLDKDKFLNFRTKWIESGYRCHDHYLYKRDRTTNHCGKAIDIHYNILSTGIRTRSTDDMNTIRKEIFNKYLGAKWDWSKGSDIFYLESSDIGAKTWVHVDVREFSQEYLIEKYFITNNEELNGQNIVQFAKELGLNNMCSCNGLNKVSDFNINLETVRRDPKELKVSNELITFIKAWEKLETKPYNDSKNYCTIGYGHLIKKHKCEDTIIPNEFKDGITEEKATEIFKTDLEVFEKAVQRDITVKLYQKEFDALVDLLFNCGAYFFSQNKAPKMLENLLNEKYEDAAKEFLNIENKKRRQQNYEMFINGNYDSTH